MLMEKTGCSVHNKCKQDIIGKEPVLSDYYTPSGNLKTIEI